MPSIDFFKHLNKKLKTGNLKSIHLNALPGRYATRLDLHKLHVVQDQLAEEFLSKLFQEPHFKFKVSFNNLNLTDLTEEQQDELNFMAKKLNGIYYQNIDNYLEHGVKTFGFGYPLLIKRSRQDPSKVIKAPLLIWHLDIEKSPQKRNVWEIKRDEDSPVNLNEVLISYLQQDERITIQKLSREYLEDDVIDRDEMAQICQEVLDQLNALPGKEFDIHAAPCPPRKKIENITGQNPWISWTGIFGLYRAQKESIINEVDELIENFESFKLEDLKFEPFQTTTITGVEETDPSQEAIINSLNNKPEKIIQGPPGTGKSQSLTAIITNALESGAKCLVVCEKKTALDVIYQNLESIGLGEFCAVIDDVSRDRRKIIDRARKKIDELKYFRPTFRAFEYNSALESYRKIKEEINQKHWEVLKTIFGDDNWKNIIGLYLSNERKASKETIKHNLNKDDYDYTYEEFQELLKIVEDGSFYFEKINEFNHPLDKLSHKIFEGPYLASTKENIQDFLNYCNEFCLDLINQYSDNLQSFGENFNKNNLWKRLHINTLSLFSKRYKKLKKGKQDFIRQYHNLISLHNDQQHFYFHFKRPEYLNNFSLILQNLKKYTNSINEILGSFHEFQEYYEWKSFFLSLNRKQKSLIQALIKSGASNWENAFKSWYYYQVLAKYESQLGPFHKDDRLIMEFSELNQSLKQMQRSKIKDLWAGSQQKSIERFKQQIGKIKSLYNYKKNKKYGRKNPLRRIINTDFQLFTDFFPVVMVNPVVSSSIIPLQEGLFDIVIFDEASQLRLEDTFTSYLKGKYKIISGDEHQMPPSNYFGKEVELDFEEQGISGDSEEDKPFDDSLESADKESLLHYATDSQFEKSYLDFHYRSRHPYLIEFSNAAFYGSRLTPMPPKSSYKPIRFISINGQYEKNRTNPTEARYVIDILFNHIKPYTNGDYPSVGIATFNIDQRNKILEMIQDECYLDNEKSQIREKLRESGLFIKNLENIQGDERDIMILSTTFGKNAEGKFRQNFGPINQFKGYKLFNVLITRAKKQLILCTSIPPEYFERYRQEIPLKGNTGKAIFYAYIAYARSIQNGDEKTRQNILKLLRDNCTEEPPTQSLGLVESPFEQEVLEYLTDYIDEGRIQPQYEFGGFRIDFMIKSKYNGKPIIAIECDGARYHESEVAYAHDMYRQRIIEREGGFYFYRIWSTNWWPDPQKEVQKLVKYIESVDTKKAPAKERLTEEYQEEILDDSYDPNQNISAEKEFVQESQDKSTERKVVTRDSKVRIKNVHDGKKMTVLFTDLKSKVDLKSSERIIVREDSPLAKALLNRGVGEKFKINGIEVFYEVLDIEN